MKSYPSIPSKLKNLGKQSVYVFDKLDGSNIRAEWSKKQGFYKYGSRNQLLDPNNPVLGGAIPLIQEQASELQEVFRSQKWERAVAFFEFYGEHSFAGSHEDEPHRVTLIDVAPYKKGMLVPKDFVEIFCNTTLDVCHPIHRGELDSTLVDDVKQSTMLGMTFEGVVCKWANKSKRQEMLKIKSRAWLNKLKDYCNGNDELFRKLA